MKKVLLVFTIMLFSVCAQSATCAEQSLGPADVPRISIEQLKAKLGDPDVAIIDVRSAHDWEDSDIMIKGAVREDPHQLDSWTKKYPQDKMTILYCK
jgi:3-mercaptopyruvate sulfurtransferase SseA